MTCPKTSCDLGDILEFRQTGSYGVYMKVRVTDLDILEFLCRKDDPETPPDKYEAGGVIVHLSQNIFNDRHTLGCPVTVE